MVITVSTLESSTTPRRYVVSGPATLVQRSVVASYNELDFRNERHSQDPDAHQRARARLRPRIAGAGGAQADPEGALRAPAGDSPRHRWQGHPHRQDGRRGHAALPSARAREGASSGAGGGAGGDRGGAGSVARVVGVGLRAAGRGGFPSRGPAGPPPPAQPPTPRHAP